MLGSSTQLPSSSVARRQRRPSHSNACCVVGRVLLACSAGLLAGCATVIKGTTQEIPIASDPAGARVLVDSQPAGVTPLNVKLARKRSHMITVELEGYETEHTIITNSVGGAVAGNILVGGLIGWGTDAISGGQYNLHPAAVAVKLRPKAGSPAGPVAASVNAFVVELSRLEELRDTHQISPEEFQTRRTALVSRYQN